MRTCILAASIITLFLVSACKEEDQEARSSVRSLESEVRELRSELFALRLRTTELEQRGPSRLLWDEASPANLGNPAEPGYALGWSGAGRFAISVEDMQPYGAGTRLTVRVLNMAAATLGNVTFKVYYADTAASADGREAAVITHSSTNRFRPNAWTYEAITIPSLPPADLKAISVALEATTLSTGQ